MYLYLQVSFPRAPQSSPLAALALYAPRNHVNSRAAHRVPLQVVIDDIVHVYHERTEISDDCKSTATHWRAGDFKGAGSAVGDIVGIILGGLEAAALQAVEA